MPPRDMGAVRNVLEFRPLRRCVYLPEHRVYEVEFSPGHSALENWLSNYSLRRLTLAHSNVNWVPEVYWGSLRDILEAACHVEAPHLPEPGHFQRPASGPWTVPDKWLTSMWGTELRPYQVSAVQFLLQGNALLGDDLGLGKTLATLWAWWLIGPGLPDHCHLIVVVPNEDVAGDWIGCIRDRMGDRFDYTLVRSRKDLDYCSVNSDNQVILIPYSKVWRSGYYEAMEALAPSSILVLDEAHRISRSGNKQHAGCYALAQRCRAVWCLSGTEVSNTPDQYYGMYRVVCRPWEGVSESHNRPAVLTDKSWVQYFRSNSSANSWIPERLESLRHLRQGFALRRVKEEVQQDLPPLTILDLDCKMDDVTRKIYRDLESECQAELVRQGNPEILTEEHFWVIYLRLIQLCSHPRLLGEERVTDPAKWERLACILLDAGMSQQIGIWSNFPGTIDWIAERIRTEMPWLSVGVAHGGVSKDERAEIKQQIQDGKLDVVVANPMIWGEGVNLQAISVGVYWDYHPSRVRYVQSLGRFHRMGQTKAVTIYRLRYTNSVDQKICQWLERKAQLARLITGN